MRTSHGMSRRIAQLGLFLMMGVSMSANAGLFGIGGTSWKEEVLLHDGSKIVVARWALRGGRHEIGQQPPIKEQSLTLTLPTSNEQVTWKRNYSEDVGLADLTPILLDVVQKTIYVVSIPVGCLSYNKWGRPNPPYVILRFHDKEWRQITLQEFPPGLATPNLLISSPDNEVERNGKHFISADEVRKINGSLRQSELRSVLREPVKLGSEGSLVNCEEMIHYKCGWISPHGTFGRDFMDRTCK